MRSDGSRQAAAPARSGPRITRGRFLTLAAGGLGLALMRPASATGGRGGVALPGVNLAGGEFGDLGRPLRQGYIYPDSAAFGAYASRGIKLVRLPFKLERVQPQAFGDFAPADIAEIDRCVRAARAAGQVIVLDAHNYGKRDGQPIAARDLADFWGRAARRFRDEPAVAYGLMNEPVAFDPAGWRSVADTAVKAIRDAGSGQRIMVPGAGWTGAHAWVREGNARAFEGFSDPNFLFEVHQYLDGDSSGSHAQDYAPGAGGSRLDAFTAWARERKAGAFLGEFGFALPAGEVEARALLATLNANADVWRAYAYWAGGPWWGDYPFSIEPDRAGDRPQMTLLREFM